MKTLFKTPEVLSVDECDKIVTQARKLVQEIDLLCKGTDEFNDYLSKFG